MRVRTAGAAMVKLFSFGGSCRHDAIDAFDFWSFCHDSSSCLETFWTKKTQERLRKKPPNDATTHAATTKQVFYIDALCLLL